MLRIIAFIIITLLLFLYGFFPINTSVYKVKDVIKPPSKIGNFEIADKNWYKQYYDRTVLIVIDALRYDFVTQNNMPFTTALVRNNGCFMNVKVESPTVTLPRIKAITTGNVPQFIDVIFNLASASVLSDSLLHQAHLAKKNMVFYGDDTWLKLFPNTFIRSEGTTSFYVNDFDEVDSNVTKNLKLELTKNDWNILILHYLGLDHIGHVLGPRSPLVATKLQEMDEAIKLTYNSLSEENALILITGDHGMKDSGGHGGSTYPETNVPLLIIGSNCLNDSISQTDISVNLAVLLGLNIPTTNTGRLRRSFLNNIPLKNYLLALNYNTYTLLKKCNICDDKFLTAIRHHELYLIKNDTDSAKVAIELYNNCSQIINEFLLRSATSQNITLLILAVLNLIYLFVALLKTFLTNNKTPNTIMILFLNTLFVITCVFNQTLGLILSCTFAIVVICKFEIIYVLKLVRGFNNLFDTGQDLFLIFFVVVHPFSLLSSSFIEEEHQYWYFICNTLFAILIIKTRKKSLKLLLCSCASFLIVRFLRTINQTGDKWSFLPDLSDWLVKSDNFLCYNLYFIASLLVTLHTCSVLKKTTYLTFANKIAVLILIYLSKTTRFQTVLLQKIVWFLIFIEFMLVFKHKSSFEIVWILIGTLLMRQYNVILLSCCVLFSNLFSKLCENSTSLTLSHLVIANILFFMQGHSNSLASIDIFTGYTALSSYQPVLVFLQVIIHTYCLPILTHLLLSKQKYCDVKTMWFVLFSYRTLVVIVFCISLIFQRQHIFIWTVFAPKLLVEACHIVVLSCEYFVYCLYNFFNKCDLY